MTKKQKPSQSMIKGTYDKKITIFKLIPGLWKKVKGKSFVADRGDNKVVNL